MKLELKAGNYYRTREGLRVKCVGELVGGMWYMQVTKEPYVAFNVHKNGHLYGDKSECGNDIVAEWREPRSAICVVVMYEALGDVSVNGFNSHDGADEWLQTCGYKEIAPRKEITMTEEL